MFRDLLIRTVRLLYRYLQIGFDPDTLNYTLSLAKKEIVIDHSVDFLPENLKIKLTVDPTKHSQIYLRLVFR